VGEVGRQGERSEVRGEGRGREANRCEGQEREEKKGAVARGGARMSTKQEREEGWGVT